MSIKYLSAALFKPLKRSGIKLSLSLIISLVVMSSPVVMFINPTPSVTASLSSDGSTLAPSTISQDGGGSEFTTQAALSFLTVRPTNNIVTTNSFYDIVFVTATAGAIKTIEVTFPAGTQMPTSPLLNEVEGIGPGTPSRSGQTTITYTIANAVNVPAGTRIRLEIANIHNPVNPSASYMVTVTTKNAANAIIDGPTQSTAYTIKQTGASVIAPNSITPTKISSNFMISRLLEDDTRGESFGWNPNGLETNFIIIDEDAIAEPNAVLINVGDEASNSQCEAMGSLSGFFTIQCDSPPPEGSELRYTIINLPSR